MKNQSRWYRRSDGVANRQLLDIDGHDIFMNTPIPKCRSVTIEGWEIRQHGQIIGIVWSTLETRGRLCWHYADATMTMGRPRFTERGVAILNLVADYNNRVRWRREALEIRAGSELAHFVL